jgi:histone H3/H4
MTSVETAWKRCSTCKKPIGFGNTWYACSVSTCNRKRTGLFFCSVECFQAHVPEMRHRDAWAEKTLAPTRAAWEQEQREERDAAARQSEAAEKRATAPELDSRDLPQDVLVVVSKLKAYVRARSGMNTSENIAAVLSDHLRRLCDEAIRNAARDDRRTVMDRDFRSLL